MLLSSFAAGVEIKGGGEVHISSIPENQTECAISKNPLDPSQLFVSCNTDPPNGGLFAAYSTDGGTSWHRTVLSPPGIADPTVTWDGFEHLYLAFIDGEAYDRIVVLLSTNGGQTFSELIGFEGFVDQPTIVATRAPGVPGTVWIAWSQNGQMYATGAAVTGRNRGDIGAFGSPQPILGTEKNCSVGDIAIAPSGAVVQVCQEPLQQEGTSTWLTDGPSRILLNVDRDGLGRSQGFGDAFEVMKTNVGDYDAIPAQSHRRVDAEVGLAFENDPASSHPTRLYLVYTDETAVDNDDMDIMLRYSDDEDRKVWSTPIRVNDDRTNLSQFLPRIAIDNTSHNIIVCWHDCRNDTNNIAVDVYCAEASSADTPPKFGHSAKISGHASKSPGTGVEFGDYSGLVFAGGAAHPVWAGTFKRSRKAGDTDLDPFTDQVTRVEGVGQRRRPRHALQNPGAVDIHVRKRRAGKTGRDYAPEP